MVIGGTRTMHLDRKDMLIAVIHSQQSPWKEIAEQGQLATWIPEAIKSEYNLVYCYGRSPSKVTALVDKYLEKCRWNYGAQVSDVRNLINNLVARPFASWIPKAQSEVFKTGGVETIGIRVPIIELYITTRWKQLSLFKHFVENTRCKYLVMITSATYLIPDKLRGELEKISLDKVYAGPLHAKNSNGVFVSGAQLILDRNFVKDLLANPKLLPTHFLNDVGLGVYARKQKITPVEMKTIDISSIEQLEQTTNEEIQSNYHFRLKSVDPITGQRQDITLFAQLHERIKSEKM
jgi:hypothetical protein